MSDLLYALLIPVMVGASAGAVYNFWKASMHWKCAAWYWRKVELIHTVSPLIAATDQWESELRDDLARRRLPWSSKRAAAQRVLDKEASKERAQ